MSGTEIVGFLAMLLFALVTGLIGGMHLGRWATRKDEGGNLKPEARNSTNRCSASFQVSSFIHQPSKVPHA